MPVASKLTRPHFENKVRVVLHPNHKLLTLWKLVDKDVA